MQQLGENQPSLSFMTALNTSIYLSECLDELDWVEFLQGI